MFDLQLVSSYFYIYRLYLYIDSNDLTHTSDHPIFKIRFDSENYGKWFRYSVAVPLVFVIIDPLNYYQIFLVLLAFFRNGYSRDIQRRKVLSY